MAWLKWLLLVGAGGYLVVVAILYLAQRSLLYFPDAARRTPASVGVPEAEEVELQTDDGERLVAWYAPARDGKPIVLYFQGNGGGLNLRAHRFHALAGDGLGVLALNYRGFGGSSGSPTEAGLLRDAEAAYAFASARYPADRIVLWGESLGTGVAIAVASKHKVARVLLESPYTSIADVASSIYWYVPVRRLLNDQFLADTWVGKITAPVLVLQGARDDMIPIAIGQRLYDLIQAPKQFLSLPQAGHNDHDEYGALDKVRPFLTQGFGVATQPAAAAR